MVKAARAARKIEIQGLLELDYRQHYLAGQGWLRLYFDYRLPFSTISGWLRLSLHTTDYKQVETTCLVVSRQQRLYLIHVSVFAKFGLSGARVRGSGGQGGRLD